MDDPERSSDMPTAQQWGPSSLHALSRLMRDGLVFLEPDGEVAYASPSALRLCHANDIDDLRALFAAWTSDVIRAARGDAAKSEEPPAVSVERELDGHTRRLELRILPIDEDACGGYIVLVTDRAGRELLDAALRRANSLGSRDALLQSIIHDLKAPMNAMILNLDLLQEAVSGSSEELDRAQALESVELVRNEVSRLERLLQSIGKTPGRFETGERERFDLRDLVTETVTLFRPQAQARRVRLVPRLPEEPFPVDAFRDQISQAVTNVVINAIEAMESAGDVEIRLDRAGTDAVLTVTDEGPGIPRAIRDLVFEAHVTTKPKGTGLGLHVTRTLMRAHGGDISIDTQSVPGTRVTLRLPIVESAN
jgi:signal transduction histidine kinase